MKIFRKRLGSDELRFPWLKDVGGKFRDVFDALNGRGRREQHNYSATLIALDAAIVHSHGDPTAALLVRFGDTVVRVMQIPAHLAEFRALPLVEVGQSPQEEAAQAERDRRARLSDDERLAEDRATFAKLGVELLPPSHGIAINEGRRNHPRVAVL